MSLGSKKNLFSSNKKIDQISNPPSQGDTFFDSMHNSKYSETSKNIIKGKKENNFYLALNCVLSPIQENIFMETSEFSEFNPNQTKDENISRYLHRPIIKEINKEGNELIRIQPKQNYDTIVKHPYTSKYNEMNNIFSQMILSLKDINKDEDILQRRTMNYNNFNSYINNIFNNENKYNTMNRRNFNKEINYFSKENSNKIKNDHQKNKSSITDNIYNNKINNYNNNYTKNKNTKKNSQINSTTITKEIPNKNNKKEEKDVQDIKKQIKYEDKLEDLEESKDIDLKNYIDEENKNIFLNDYNSNISSLNSNKKINIMNNHDNEEIFINQNKKTNQKASKQDEIFIFDSFVNNMNTSEKNNLNISKSREKGTTTIKRLRKKYERTEFKKYIYYTNPEINRYSNEYHGNINFDSNIHNIRKMTLETNKKIFGSNDSQNNIKNKIYYTIKKSNKYEGIILSPESKNNNINKNLLENFNDCGSAQDNDFLISNNKTNEKNNCISNNKETNKIVNNDIDSKNNSPEAEFLDFISNKSEKAINNYSSSRGNKENNQNNTFIVKEISNKKESIKDTEQNVNTMTYGKSNSPKSEKISIRKYTSSMSQSCYEENYNNTYNINKINKNCLYDYISPEKNPDALIRRNFSLMSSFENDMNESSFFDGVKNDYHSCKNKIKYSKYYKDFSLINESRQSEYNCSNILLNKSMRKKNNLYLINNKEKLKDSLINQVPETVYDLTFYQNLIDNSKKIKKINYNNILKNQKKVKWVDRLHTLCWMMQICEEFAFKRDTYHYACDYFDHYLAFSKEKIKNANILQLIGITCISISGKIEEVQIPKLKEYANSIDDIFGIKDIIEMEQKICLTLGWKLINTNINTWLNWYICQWDLYIDSVDDIKEQLLKYINEEDIIYYKKSIDSSYYNYRKISQLTDIIILDYYSYSYDHRVLIAVCLLVIICINYNFDYNFKKKNFKQKTKFSKYIFDIYIQFINQSFDFNFFDKNIQKALEYVFTFKNLHFSYELPLFYQINQDMLEYGNYEDFISYQTTNEKLEDYMKNIYAKRNIKSSSEKTTTHTEKNKFFSSQKSSLK